MSAAADYVPKLIAGAAEYAATQHNITNQYVARAPDDPADLVVHSYAVALHFDTNGSRPRDGRRVPRPRPAHRPRLARSRTATPSPSGAGPEPAVP